MGLRTVYASSPSFQFHLHVYRRAGLDENLRRSLTDFDVQLNRFTVACRSLKVQEENPSSVDRNIFIPKVLREHSAGRNSHKSSSTAAAAA